ncbi:hypothetical protein SAMN05444851_2657 [Aliiroseovarius sediminilitoris]|uniref:Uncharacterized protein n=1 Tax=Aliiroseovarius sediminilitoris TaxID=1173584 RepID=A0A1I0QLC1_9RHOB|nr:hypothetical protein SAMN05444851_2657 [Aliiroseovarius sediminilitoris]
MSALQICGSSITGTAGASYIRGRLYFADNEKDALVGRRSRGMLQMFYFGPVVTRFTWPIFRPGFASALP